MSIAEVFPDGRLILNGQVYRACIGRGGSSERKMEGDGTTPRGLLALRRVLYRADRVPPPKAAVPIEPLAPNDGWCDAPYDVRYNRPVEMPFNASSEALWRSDAVYDVIGVLGWNDAPVVRDRGSAIFLHVARPDYAPTEGCVALSKVDLITVLALGVDALNIH